MCNFFIKQISKNNITFYQRKRFIKITLTRSFNKKRKYLYKNSVN